MDIGKHGDVRLASVEFISVEVTDRTTWTHALFRDDDCVEALVEIPSWKVVKQIARLMSELGGQKLVSEDEITALLGIDEALLCADQSLGASVSAIRTGVVLINAERRGLSLTETLGGTIRDSVELYANINRALFTTRRKPEDFAVVADWAVRAGFSTFKCAPFDEAISSDTTTDAAKAGLERVAAVRRVIGPQARLLVDCHGRFSADTAPRIAGELSDFDVAWFEEPVDPTSIPGELARIASEVDLPVAGGEHVYGSTLFNELVASGATSVIMPDIQYCGGVVDATWAGRQAVADGAGFSLHCPSGPVSLLASGHVTVAVDGAMPLEHAVYEAEWRADLMDPPELVEAGRLWFPGGAGLGASLNYRLINMYGRRWKP